MFVYIAALAAPPVLLAHAARLAAAGGVGAEGAGALCPRRRPGALEEGLDVGEARRRAVAPAAEQEGRGAVDPGAEGQRRRRELGLQASSGRVRAAGRVYSSSVRRWIAEKSKNVSRPA